MFILKWKFVLKKQKQKTRLSLVEELKGVLVNKTREARTKRDFLEVLAPLTSPPV